MINIIRCILLCYFPIAHAVIESGFYLNPSIGYGYVSNNTRYNPTNNTSVSVGLMGGYAFNKYLAVDGGVTFMPNSSPKNYTNYYLTNVAARGSVPIGNFVSAYIHLGAASLISSSNMSNQAGFFVGGGGLFHINKHLSINIEDYGIYIPGNISSNINILALGLVYGF